jgi:hypothetical protein
MVYKGVTLNFIPRQCSLDSSGSGQTPVLGPSENGPEPSGFVKGEILSCWETNSFFRRTAPWTWGQHSFDNTRDLMPCSLVIYRRCWVSCCLQFIRFDQTVPEYTVSNRETQQSVWVWAVMYFLSDKTLRQVTVICPFMPLLTDRSNGHCPPPIGT